MVKTKPNQKIHVNKLQSTLDKLDKLEKKPKLKFTLRESIYFLREKLKNALKKGYSYEDLSVILQEQKILISASTLKQYLTDIGKSSKAKQRNRSSTNKIAKSNSANKKAKKNTDLQTNFSSSTTAVLERNTPNQVKKTYKSKQTNSETSVETKTKTKVKELSSNRQDLAGDFNHY